MFQRPSQPDIETDIVIIGAGPAGIFSAIELKKRGKDVWILGSQYESQLAKAGPLSEVTTIPEGTIGLDYMEDLMQKAKDIGVKHKSSLSTGISVSEKIEVKTKHQKFIANRVIIATGAKQAKLGFAGESDYLHKGISDCTVCDFGLFRGKKVAVLGNHEYTWRASKFMIPHVDKVTLLWYKQPLDKSVQDFEVFDEVDQLEAIGNDTLSGVKFVSKGNNHEVQLDGLFVEGKPVPSTDFLAGCGIELDENKFIIINDSFQTNLSNVYAIGDVTGRTKNYESVVDEVDRFLKSFK